MQQSPFKGRSGLARISKALGYSRDGLVSAWLHESAFRQAVLLAAVMTMLAFLLPQAFPSVALGYMMPNGTRRRFWHVEASKSWRSPY